MFIQNLAIKFERLAWLTCLWCLANFTKCDTAFSEASNQARRYHHNDTGQYVCAPTVTWNAKRGIPVLTS